MDLCNLLCMAILLAGWLSCRALTYVGHYTQIIRSNSFIPSVLPGLPGTEGHEASRKQRLCSFIHTLLNWSG